MDAGARSSAGSPDETILYVAKTGRTHVPDLAPVIRAYPVQPGGTIGPGRDFATCPVGLFDGFRVDRAGHFWTSSAEAVRAHAPDSTEIGRIPIPELVSHLCFGGSKRNRLFITAQTSLYAINVNSTTRRCRPGDGYTRGQGANNHLQSISAAGLI